MNERDVRKNPFAGIGQFGMQRPDQYELTIHQDGQSVKLDVEDHNMIDILRTALKNDCGVHIAKIK